VKKSGNGDDEFTFKSVSGKPYHAMIIMRVKKNKMQRSIGFYSPVTVL